MIDRSRVWIKTFGRCWYCGTKFASGVVAKYFYQDDLFEVDHVISKKRGGSDNISNLAPACRKCNREKDEKTLEGYRKHKESISRTSSKNIHGLIRLRRIKYKFWGEKEGMKL